MADDDDKYYILKDENENETRRILKDSPEGKNLTEAIEKQIAIQKIIDEREKANSFKK